MSRIEVWIDERVESGPLGPLPAEVALHTIRAGEPLPSAVSEAEVLVPFSDRDELLRLLPQLRRLALIQVVSAGVDWIAPHLPREVTLCNARGLRDDPVAEWALAAILAFEKRLIGFGRAQRRHEWAHAMAGELRDRRALIVGYGSIGRCLGQKLEALGVRVEGVASRARDGVHGVAELPALLGQQDHVILLAPLTQDTRGLFDAGMLARMRDGALLVNAGRGALVDTDALLAELECGRLRAALDVVDPEPLPAEHALWDAPGVLITPHMAGDSPEAAARAYRFAGEQIARYARGEPLRNVVQPASPSSSGIASNVRSAPAASSESASASAE